MGTTLKPVHGSLWEMYLFSFPTVPGPPCNLLVYLQVSFRGSYESLKAKNCAKLQVYDSSESNFYFF
jgi:hypothetical protein